MKTIIKRAFALTVLSTLLFSCGGSDDTTPEADTNSGITMSLKVTGDPESEYVVNTSSVMEGTISAEGNGFESTDWNFVYNVGSSVFVVGYTDFKAQVYQENDNGEVEEVSSFQLAFPLEVFGNVDDETLLAIDAPRDGSHNGRKLYTVNAETGLVEDPNAVSSANADVSLFLHAIQFQFAESFFEPINEDTMEMTRMVHMGVTGEFYDNNYPPSSFDIPWELSLIHI